MAPFSGAREVAMSTITRTAITRTIPLALAACVLVAAASSTPASAGVSFGFFYENLSPHGSWVFSGSYGNVWRPSVYGPGWHPYYDGHWVYTDVGYTWISDYAWGGIPYHYGTWAFDPAYGWVWVPGYVWAPAWVVFREGPDYIGWAPVAPRFSVGVTLARGDYDDAHFVFVPHRHFIGGRVRSFAAPVSRTRIIVNKTRIIDRNLRVENNVVVNRGPDVRTIERFSGRSYRPVALERAGGPGRAIRRDEIRLDRAGSHNVLRAAEPNRDRAAVRAGADRRDQGGQVARRSGNDNGRGRGMYQSRGRGGR